MDNPQYYGAISRFFHWTMAAAFAFMLFTAIMFMQDDYSWMGAHKTTGFVLTILVLLRVIWAAMNAKNRPHGDLIVKLGHAAIYALMIAVPVVALIRQAGSTRGDLVVFGMTIIQKAPVEVKWMTGLGNALHGTLGFALFALAAGHIVMAIVHQAKGEKIINRMIGK